jgi:hypothetical protein
VTIFWKKVICPNSLSIGSNLFKNKKLKKLHSSLTPLYRIGLIKKGNKYLGSQCHHHNIVASGSGAQDGGRNSPWFRISLKYKQAMKKNCR